MCVGGGGGAQEERVNKIFLVAGMLGNFNFISLK